MTKVRIFALALCLGIAGGPLEAQTVTSFEGINASQLLHPELDVDPNGAVGTKQFMEWTNVAFQAYDKVTLAPVWSAPQPGISPWETNGMNQCDTISGDGSIIFDRLASRWVIAAHSSASNDYNYCVAISNTDDLSSPSLAWYTYAFPLNSALGTNAEGNVYFPDWPHIGTWWDAYYVGFDVTDNNLAGREEGVLVCAFDRTDMLVNAAARTPICFEQPDPITTNVYLGHSVIPADVEGTIPPPAGRDEFLVSIENPVLNGTATTSTSFNLWDFHVDWTSPSESSLTESSLTEEAYHPGCYTARQPVNTVCVPEPSTSSTGQHIDSVGDRFMPRMSYRNFGSYESFVISHTVQPGSTTQTAVRWYELRANGSGLPSIYQDGNLNPDNSLYRFMPSIAEDANGNAAVGYSISSSSVHPGMNASYFSLTNPETPTEITLYDGSGDEENSYHMGDYSSMTVDPENGCTFWYVNQYFPTNQTGSKITWGTRISNFSVPSCGGNATLSPGTVIFSEQSLGTTSAPQIVTLNNTQSVILNISNITATGVDSGDFAAPTNTCGSTLGPGATCTISVTFTPRGLGTRTASLEVFDSAGNSPQTATLTGTGGTPVTLSTSSLSFGTVLLGTHHTAPAVILTNNQTVALTNIQISTSGSTAFSQANTCSNSIAAGGQCQIEVTFAPTQAGTQTGAVNIRDNATNSPQSISLRGTGGN
ncbi:MAG: choice-of-anchor D domain-containing protein [Candidatus Sulfotelmatobacter sp.]